MPKPGMTKLGLLRRLPKRRDRKKGRALLPWRNSEMMRIAQAGRRAGWRRRGRDANLTDGIPSGAGAIEAYGKL